MFAHSGHVMTLANSIICVGILAMPFCFQKCGIILSILLLIISNWITRISCHYLIKSSLLTRRKSFEILGFQAFGSSGKLLVELCIIGYLLGTCITYFVVVGDLGPQIITKMFALTDGYMHLRTWIMIVVTLVCILPLGMLKNVDSLSTVCTASIGFYICFVFKIILESGDHILANDWSEDVLYWQPSGILQCLPIFGMALSCQMQIFEVFGSINNQSVEKLNKIVRNATWICTIVYVAVGFFGYVAFCTQTFSGNILVNFSPSFGSDVIKIGFLLSVAFSFPLVIFPCRASIYSLLYRKGQMDSSAYIPESRFKAITFIIVVFALAVALMIPSVELIIGLVGSTIGVAICIIFPAACFRKIVKKDSNERALGHLIIVGGFCLMILGTYANLNAIDEKRSDAHISAIAHEHIIDATRANVDIKVNFDATNVRDEPKIRDHKQLAEEQLPDVGKSPVQISMVPIDRHQPGLKLVRMKFKNNDIDMKTQPPETLLDVKQPVPVQPSQQTGDSKPNLTLTSARTIDQEAIKKDDEIEAEEIKINKDAHDELEKAKKELKETKKLLEKKVDEIKEELAKQNKETHDLVVEKLGEVVEKVEEIERKVQKSEPLATDAKHKEQAKKDIPVHKGALLKLLSNSVQLNKSAQNDAVYEPLSYKTGELIQSSRTDSLHDSRPPLPLALLINASQAKLSDSLATSSKPSLEGVTTKLKPLSSQQPVGNQEAANPLSATNDPANKPATAIDKSVDAAIANQSLNAIADSKENVEAIRREILQVKGNQLLESATTTKTETHARLKRSNDHDASDCKRIETTFEQSEVLPKLNVEGEIDFGIKTYGTGRDLKALSESDTKVEKTDEIGAVTALV